MIRPKAVVQLVMMIGEAVSSILSVAVIYLLISRRSGPDLLGEYSTVTAWMLLFQSLGAFGIPEFILREVGRFVSDRSKYFAQAIWIGAASSLTATLVMIVAASVFPYPRQLETALFVGSLAVPPFLGSMVSRAALLALGRAQVVFSIVFFESLVITSVNAFLVIRGRGLFHLVLTIVIAKWLSCLFYLYAARRRSLTLSREIDTRFCRFLLPSIFTFAVSTGLGLVARRINILMLSFTGSLAAVGVYAAANALLEVLLMLPAIVGQLLLPRLAHDFANLSTHRPRQLKDLIVLLSCLTIPLGLGIIVFAPQIVATLFGQSFAGAVTILRVLMVFFIIESADTMLGVVLKAAAYQKWDVWAFSANPLANVLLNFFLIPLWGGAGAALARVIAVSCSFSIRCCMISRHLGKPGLVARDTVAS